IRADDRTVSAIRIVDTVNVIEQPESGTGLEIGAVRLLAIIKKGYAEGKIDFVLMCVPPAGESEPVGLATVEMMEGDAVTGYNIVLPLRVNWNGPGMYWYELRANNVVIARTPLKVAIQKPEAAT